MLYDEFIEDLLSPEDPTLERTNSLKYSLMYHFSAGDFLFIGPNIDNTPAAYKQ